jgi:hypothetical protein
MRKITVMSIAIVFAMGSAFAQETQQQTEKRSAGKDFSEILPQQGDFALGLDMGRFVTSILNSITSPAWNNQTSASSSVLALQNDFFGKYFLTNNSALRLRLGLTVDNSTNREFVNDEAANLSNPSLDNDITRAKTVDVWKQRYTDIELGIGYEYRRSLWRVQGYVGGEIFGGVDFYRDYFEYGNPMTDINQTPETTDFGFNRNSYGTGSFRLLDEKTIGFKVGAAAYVGADLFICRNLSIGAEFDLQGVYSGRNEYIGTTETWLFDQAYKAEEKYRPAQSAFRITPMGRFNLMIYF